MGRVREASAAIRDTPEMTGAREALAGIQSVRDEIMAAGSVDEMEALKQAEHAALFRCELALQSLTSLIDHMAGERS